MTETRRMPGWTMFMLGRGLIGIVVAVVPPILACAAEGQAEGKVDFNRDIRPILSANCFACHGPDDAKRKAGLRLDKPESAFAPAKSGDIAIVPHKPEASQLIQRIAADDPDDHMPPADFGKDLTPRQIRLLEKWIAEGAEYQKHWAYIPPRRPELPVVMESAWPRNEIDRFVLAALEAKGIRHSPEVDKATLMRRVSLDLTGLPPTPAEVDAFIADQSAKAYEKVVNRLLASPRYGERMAMQWLDFARYADSNGYQADYERYQWRWRDGVLNAFNQNMPFDQFTIEQLAGDLLPSATEEQKIATGFNRNHRINTEGGTIPEEWRVETVIDRVETTSEVWLGLTMGCCRCHDHKYDPLSQKDFYSFYAFFNNVPETGGGAEKPVNHPPFMKAPSAADRKKLAEMKLAVDAAVKIVKEKEANIPALLAAWESSGRELAEKLKGEWTVVDPKSIASTGGATLKKMPDGSYLAGGKNPNRDVYTITASAPSEPITAILLEVFTDPSMVSGSVGRASNGNFVLGEIEAEASESDGKNPVKGKFIRAAADYSQKDWEVGKAIDGKPETGWAVDGHVAERRGPHRASFVFDKPLVVPDGGAVTIRLRQQALDQHNIGRFRLSTSSRPANELTLDSPMPSDVIAALEIGPEKRDPKQTAALLTYFRNNFAGDLTAADKALAAARQAQVDFEASVPTVMVMEEMPKPREAYVLVRGVYDKHGDKVTAAVPASLLPMPPGSPNNRLGLAKWIVDPANPLTGRVWVNRAWEKFFGTGIVKTSENLGSQAEWPTNPELLDWLATEFVRLKWDMKAMQKEMVMSAAYRQSSRVTPELLEQDPENRLLARGPRFRLAAELIRDQALSASGLLAESIGGPSVRPYMPLGVWDETATFGNLRNYKADSGEGLYRRTMYTIWKRTAPPPTMILFDAPSREICTVKRSRTDTPLQALALLNEVTYVEASRALAQKMMLEGGQTPAQRIAYGYKRVTCRTVDAADLGILSAGFEARLAKYRADVASAKKLIAAGASKADPKLDPAELAAYTMTANVLLNLDETVTRE